MKRHVHQLDRCKHIAAALLLAMASPLAYPPQARNRRERDLQADLSGSFADASPRLTMGGRCAGKRVREARRGPGAAPDPHCHDQLAGRLRNAQCGARSGLRVSVPLRLHRDSARPAASSRARHRRRGGERRERGAWTPRCRKAPPCQDESSTSSARPTPASRSSCWKRRFSSVSARTCPTVAASPTIS